MGEGARGRRGVREKGQVQGQKREGREMEAKGRRETIMTILN